MLDIIEYLLKGNSENETSNRIYIIIIYTKL